jgi:hypothetical protein
MEGKDREIEQKRKLQGGKGSTGGPLFTNLDIRHRLYSVHRTADAARLTNAEQCSYIIAAYPINAQAITIGERNVRVCYILFNPSTPG